ncbi:MAG: hypothetical protein ACE5HA_18525 [Anaerolineae bacterium]
MQSASPTASPPPTTAEVAPTTGIGEPLVRPTATDTPPVATPVGEAAPRRLSPSPTPPAPAVSEAPSGSAGPAQVEVVTPGSSGRGVARRGLLAGGVFALVALMVAGWLYSFLHKGSHQ